MPNLIQDLRHALRRLRLSPGFTLIAIGIMGLGIGSNTAMFSIVNAFLYRPLPYEAPDEIVRIYTEKPGRPVANLVSYPDFLDLRDHSDLFSAVAATSDMDFFSLATEDGKETVLGEFYSADFFSSLGVRPALGRGFLPEEDKPGTEPTVMVSFAEWQGRYGGDPEILGRSVRVNGLPLTVVGVGPEGYRGMLPGLASEYWMPMGIIRPLRPTLADQLEDREVDEFQMTARLLPGVSIEQVRAKLGALAANLALKYPESNAERTVLVLYAKDVHFQPGVDKALFPMAAFLMAIVALVLLVACSNLGNLLLMRASARRKEVAIRLALGASRSQLIAQLLLESVLLAVAGGLAGLLLARFTVSAITSFRPPIPLAFSIDYQLDPRVLGFTLLLSLATGILFGLAPAFKASRPDLIPTLKDENPSMGETGRFSLRNVLVVAQVALSMMLLVGAGLFVRSIGNQQRVDPGFESEHTAIVTLDLSLHGITDEDRGRDLFERYQKRIASVPGVESVALTSRVPLGIFGFNRRPVHRPGADFNAEEEPRGVVFSLVSSEFFETLEIPILEGRAIGPTDTRGSAPVVVVSEALARETWDSIHVVGETLYLGASGQGTPAQVIGVAKDTKVRSLREEPQPYFYLPLAQEYSPVVSLVARTRGTPAGLPEVFRRELRELDRDLPLLETKTMAEHLGLMLWGARMTASLLTGFGLLALTLASLGLYGIVAFSVAQRTREVGIRIALGASGAQVVEMILRQAMGLVGVGLLVGGLLSALAMRPLESLLMEVSSTDPATLGLVALLLFGVSIGASFVPASRAARADPMKALRSE